MSRPPNPYIRHALELEHELISLYKETLNYERARSESAQAKLDKVLRLTDTPNLGTSIRDAKIRGIQSPMKQKYTLESESRKKYWENKVKDAPDLPEAVTSKNLD